MKIIKKLWFALQIYGYDKTPDDWCLATWEEYDNFPYWLDWQTAWEVAKIVLDE